jgi:hydrogenase maturation protease
MARVLVYGYGNPGRLDDGLGPALVEELAARGPGDDVALETGYQLQVEDAALVAPFELVVFADAHASCPPPFELRELVPRHDADFTTHSLAPEAVLALARDLYGSRARGFALGIRGECFDDYGERLSPAATRHLGAAAAFLQQALSRRTGDLRCPSPGR